MLISCLGGQGEERDTWPTMFLLGVRPQAVHTLSTLDAMASLCKRHSCIVLTQY